MAYDHQWVPDLTLVAAADLSAKQYFFVKVDSNGKAAVCAAATDKPVGVLQNKPKSGEPATVRVLGVSKVSSNAALAEGDLIGPSTDGQAEPKVDTTDVAEYYVGQMLTETAAADEIGTALINCITPVHPKA